MQVLGEEEGRMALEHVREAIRTALEGGERIAGLGGGGFDRPCGVFVTLHKAGHLRGCIGQILSDQPLGKLLADMALSSAFDDPRFRPLKPDEWEQCSVEISVLSPPESVAGFREIRLGRHGIILECGGRSSVFLPQVAGEQGWTLEETLNHLSMKAGLPSDAWEREDCRFKVFEAQILR